MSIVGIVAAVLVTSVVILTARSYISTNLHSILTLSFLARVITGIFIIPYLPYMWDIQQFHRVAMSIMGGDLPNASSTVASYATIQSVIYSIFVPDTQVISIINGLVAITTIFPIIKLSHSLYPNRDLNDRILAILVLFAPLSLLFMTLPMRDAFGILLVFTLLNLINSVVQSYTYWPALLSIPLLGMLYYIRPELFYLIILGGVSAVSVMVFDFLLEDEIPLPVLLVCMGGSGLFGFILFSNKFPLETLNAIVAGRAHGGAAYLENVTYSSWMDVLLSAPLRAIYFQFAPFPLHVNSLFDLLAAMVTGVLIIITISAVRSLYTVEFDRLTFVLLGVVYVAGVVGYGLIDSNFGTTVRHRIPFVYILFIFATPVYELWGDLLSRWMSVWPTDNEKYRE